MKLHQLLVRVSTTAALICLIVVSGGFAYNALSNYYYRQIAGVPGKLYNIGGRSMHLYCTGEGSPRSGIALTRINV